MYELWPVFRYRAVSERTGAQGRAGAASSSSPHSSAETASSPKKTKSDAAKGGGGGAATKGGSGAKGKKDPLWLNGVCPVTSPVLDAYLIASLPAAGVTVQDPSMDVLALLRILHAFNRHSSCMYQVLQLNASSTPAECVQYSS